MLDFYALARAARWAVEHPEFEQPQPFRKGEWVTWIQDGKLCYTQLERDLPCDAPVQRWGK